MAVILIFLVGGPATCNLMQIERQAATSPID